MSRWSSGHACGACCMRGGKAMPAWWCCCRPPECCRQPRLLITHAPAQKGAAFKNHGSTLWRFGQAGGLCGRLAYHHARNPQEHQLMVHGLTLLLHRVASSACTDDQAHPIPSFVICAAGNDGTPAAGGGDSEVGL